MSSSMQQTQELQRAANIQAADSAERGHALRDQCDGSIYAGSAQPAASMPDHHVDKQPRIACDEDDPLSPERGFEPHDGGCKDGGFMLLGTSEGGAMADGRSLAVALSPMVEPRARTLSQRFDSKLSMARRWALSCRSPFPPAEVHLARMPPLYRR